MELDEFIYRTYDDDHYKFSFHHWQGEGRKHRSPDVCENCHAWVDVNNKDDPRDHRNFHLAWCSPYPKVGKYIAKTNPPPYHIKEAEVIDAVCDVIRRKSRKSEIDDGVDVTTIFHALILSKPEKHNSVKPSRVISKQDVAETNPPDISDDSSQFITEIKEEILKLSEDEYWTPHKKYLDANKFDVMNALDILEELSYVHFYMVNGTNYYFIPKQSYV